MTMDNLNNSALLKTIKISKNLFSLTERLPKPKYRKNINYSTCAKKPNLDNSELEITNKINGRNNSMAYNTPHK